MPRPDASPSDGPTALRPEWPVPACVRAVFTLRGGGVSGGHCASLNLGTHVQDDPAAVAENRRRVAAAFALPSEPAWLAQVHGTRVVRLGAAVAQGAAADAVVTAEVGPVCVIQVADCLPVLFAARDGSVVGAAHAGWRGLVAGVLEQTVAALAVPPGELLAWLGPGIGPEHFEVGAEVREAFLGAASARTTVAVAAAFVGNARGRWQCNLAALARQRLTELGVNEVYGGQWCTFADSERFFSHRRDGRSGRMAALIWRT
jgi:YfiH family protein